MASSDRFGFVWKRYPAIVPEYELQFRAWVAPLSPEAFQGKRVLDAGCGTGRNAFWALQYGASEVVAFDLDEQTVQVAKENLSPRAKVVRASIYEIEFENEFDIVFSIGVIHHLKHPQQAVANLVRAARSGGTVLVWVYSREGHTGLKMTLNAIRQFTSKLPVALVHVLTYPFSFLFFLYLRSRFFSPRHPYLHLLRTARVWHVHSILLDQLLPAISHYWTREEALALFDGLPVRDLQIRFCNEGSWTLWAQRKVNGE
jgi:SAM-dependent methyltransferase